MKNSWLKCRQCSKKMRKKTHRGGINCLQCDIKLVKKKDKENVKSK